MLCGDSTYTRGGSSAAHAGRASRHTSTASEPSRPRWVAAPSESEPNVADRAAVPRQILPCAQPLEAPDRNIRHRLRLRQTQIDPHAALAGLVEPPPAPEGYAAALRVEVELDGIGSDVGFRLARDLDPFSFVTIGPEHAVPPTHRAIAGGRAIRVALELPVNCAAMTGSLDHLRC